MSKNDTEIKKENAYTKEFGVLLSDQIQKYVDDFGLIQEFDPANLKAASYDFRLGEVYRVGAVERELNEQNPYLTIKPHEAVVVRTKESLKMPKDLVGRWNLRVSKVYDGLVWVGGVHIDPGWEGPLWCPLYNLSKEAVTLKRNETFASIDFETTTNFKEGVSKTYVRQRSEPKHAGSGLEKIRDEVEEFPKQLSLMQQKLDRYQANIVTVLSVIIAAITIIAVLPYSSRVDATVQGQVDQTALLVSLFALILAILLLVVRFSDSRHKEEVTDH